MVSPAVKYQGAYIGLHLIRAHLGTSKSNALVALHVLTGCDITSFPAGAKVTGKKAQLSLLNDSTIVSHLETFGTFGPIMTRNDRTIGLRFILKLYSGTYTIDDPIDEIYDRIRWQLITTKSGRQKPNPSITVAECHIARAVYGVHQFRNAHIPILQLPDPRNSLGWDENVEPRTGGTILKCDRKDESCSCKSRCKTNRCGCSKIGRNCGLRCSCWKEGCLAVPGKSGGQEQDTSANIRYPEEVQQEKIITHDISVSSDDLEYVDSEDSSEFSEEFDSDFQTDIESYYPSDGEENEDT